jgi:hypothetical protein
MIQITCYATIYQIFSDEIMKYSGFLEVAAGLGNTIGNFLANVYDIPIGAKSDKKLNIADSM